MLHKLKAILVFVSFSLLSLVFFRTLQASPTKAAEIKAELSVASTMLSGSPTLSDDIESYGLDSLSDLSLQSVRNRCEQTRQASLLCEQINGFISRFNNLSPSSEIIPGNINLTEAERCGNNVCLEINGGEQFIELTPEQADRLRIRY